MEYYFRRVFKGLITNIKIYDIEGFLGVKYDFVKRFSLHSLRLPSKRRGAL